MTATKILDNLYLGDMEDARYFNGAIIFVGESVPKHEPSHFIHIQVLLLTDPVKVNRQKMNQAIQLIAKYLAEGKPVLVHCYVGSERSPLVVACYLVQSGKARNLYEAYNYIIERRPIVQNRMDWL